MHLNWGYCVRLHVDVMLMLPIRLLVIAMAALVWQVWLDERGWGCGGAKGERVGEKWGWLL